MLFEIHDGYLRRKSVKFNCNLCIARTCSCSFRLSCSIALQVMASTLDCAHRRNYTRAGVRRHLKSATGVDLRRTYAKFYCVVRAYVKQTGPYMVQSASNMVRSISIQSPFNSRLTSVFIKRSGVKQTAHGRFFAHTVYCKNI